MILWNAPSTAPLWLDPTRICTAWPLFMCDTGHITQPLDVSLPLQENRAVTACDELRCPLRPCWKAPVSTQSFGWDCSHLKEGVVLFADERMTTWSFTRSSNVEFQRFSNLHTCSICPILNISPPLLFQPHPHCPGGRFERPWKGTAYWLVLHALFSLLSPIILPRSGTTPQWVGQPTEIINQENEL